MAKVRTAGMRASRNKGRAKPVKGDGLATTPTQYGSTSPDYVKQAGDPSWMGQYSEEQIGMQGGRDRMQEVVAAKERRAAQASTLTESGIESGGTTEGPTTPPTTYGTDPFEAYGLPGGLPNGDGTNSTADMTEPGGGVMPDPAKVKGPLKKRAQPGPAAKKQKLLGRISKTTGTTRGEARGIMRKARTQVRRGNTAGARRTISRALSGGPRAGVKSSPQRTKKAGVAATKITKRIQTRQAAAPKRKRK
jgi:hypothetical protein